MKKRIFIITILSIAMLTACNESGKTNDISKNGQDKKQAEKLEINTKKDSDKEEAKEAKEEKETQDNDTTSESDENQKRKQKKMLQSVCFTVMMMQLLLLRIW